MKKINKLMVTFLILGLIAFTGCSDMVKEQMSSDEGYVSIVIDSKFATSEMNYRTAFPSMEKAQLSQLVLKRKSGTEEVLVDSWNTVSELESAKVKIPLGTYTFTLTATIDSLKLAGTCEKEIKTSGNTLAFNLDVVSTDKDGFGKAYYKVTFANSAVKAASYQITPYPEGKTLTGDLKVNKGSTVNYVEFSDDYLKNNVYLLHVIFYSDTDKNVEIGSTSEIIYTGCNKTTSIENFDNIYSIDYVLNGGSFTGDYIQNYSRLIDIDLPLNLDKKDAVFAGWYKESDFTTRIDGWKKGTTEGTVKVFAKWLDYAKIENNGSINAFVISPYEVTQSLYKSIMNANPSNFKTDAYEGEIQDLRPVEYVSWYDAVYFCNLYSVKHGLTPYYLCDGSSNVTTWSYTPHKGSSITVTTNSNANGYRLPTTAEWTYAANGGDNKDTFTYSGSNAVDEVAWYSDIKTHQSGLKKPNSIGLYDMSGNVREWCYDSIYCKGGSYNSSANYCSVQKDESANYKFNRFTTTGFRIVRSVE